MKNSSSIENKVDAALNSIDNIGRASPSPFFYSKVMGKIRNEPQTVWERWSSFFLRPTIAFATVCLIIVINAFVIYSNITGSFSLNDQAEVTLSDEYNAATTSLYDIENVVP
jgi:hypothetical protein